MSTRIKAVAVVVPARDEQDLLAATLNSVARALDRVRSGVRTCVCVVADRCSDATGMRALALSDRFDEFSLVVNSTARSLGEVRDLGVVRALQMMLDLAAEDVWLLHTDADTSVPAGWVLEHLSHAERGVHAVAGRAVIRRWEGAALRVRHRYEALVAERISPHSHDHVYGANLGVRGDAFHAVDGFPAISCGEDQALWARLAHAGYVLRQPNETPVFTSGRTRGRARGGLADLLHELANGEPYNPFEAPRGFEVREAGNS